MRPRTIVWLEAIAFVELGLFLALTFFDPIEEGYIWPDIAVAALIFALTLCFTKWRKSVARVILIVLNGLTIPAAIYAALVHSQLQPPEVLWDLTYLLLSTASLLLLFSRPAREWAQTSVEATGDQA